MEDNTEYTATSSMIVDLSGDNDNVGAITAANSLPKTPEDSPFERSCDNPECSAPRLISLVPKRETAEFVTEPMVMNQPTLVNGFTTVFQVDGLAAKMNDIMNGNFNDAAAEGYGDQSKPKTVFRIVPNTHAHIVNYVVVDGAGETMKKIKSNDPDTMRKLLDSQRLSAEQMLRKLISKAFKKNPEPTVPLPIPSKVPGYTHLRAPENNTGKPGADPLPSVPTGITITPVDPIKVPETPLVINISPKLPTKANSGDLSTENAASKLSADTSNEIDSNGRPQRKLLPKEVAAKDSPSKFVQPQVSTTKVNPSKGMPPLKPTSVATKNVPKSTPTITTPVKTMTLAVTTASSLTSASVTTSAVTPPTRQSAPSLKAAGNASLTPAKLTPSAAVVSPKTVSTVVCTKSTPNQIGTSTTVTLTSTSASALAKAHQIPVTEPTKTVPNILKRRHPTDTPDAVKRLRPRSPKQKAPLAVGLEPSSKFPSPTRKLPTLPKLPTKPPVASNPPSQPNQPLKKAPAVDPGAMSCAESVSTENIKEVAPKSRSLEIAKAFASCLSEPEKSASGSDAANKSATVRSLAAKVSAALAGNSGVTRIGETLITPTNKAKEDKSLSSQAKQSLANAAGTSKVVEEAPSKTTDTTATAKPSASLHSTTVLTTISKLTPAGPKIIAQTKTNLEPIKLPRHENSPEKDPLALDDLEKSSPLSTKSMSPTDTMPMTRLLTKSTLKDSEPSSQILPTQPDVKAPSKSQVTTPMTTRASAPKAATPTAALTKQDKILSGTPIRTLRVMLPALKSGVMTLPVRSPHPNLKISSVISGSAVAETLKTNNPKPSNSDEKSSEIDKLQKELADLRRTVQRLSRKKS